MNKNLKIIVAIAIGTGIVIAHKEMEKREERAFRRSYNKGLRDGFLYLNAKSLLPESRTEYLGELEKRIDRIDSGNFKIIQKK